MKKLIFLLVLFLPFYSSAKTVKYEDLISSNLDRHSFRINSNSSDAKKYYNFGKLFFYGFNYGEAEYWFKKSIAADPECVMCYYSLALTMPKRIKKEGDQFMQFADNYVNEGLKLVKNVDSLEYDLLNAADMYFTLGKISTIEERKVVFYDYLQKVAKKYPSDLDVIADLSHVYIEMNSFDCLDIDKHKLIGDFNFVVKSVNNALNFHKDHPGLNYNYIYLADLSGKNKFAEENADRFNDELVIGIDSYYQIPAKIYSRTGKTHEAYLSSLKGKETFEKFFSVSRASSNYYVCNYLDNIFQLQDILGKEGQSTKSIQMAKELYNRSNMVKERKFFKDIYFSNYLTKLVKFAKWGEIKEINLPNDVGIYSELILAYANGMANAKNNNTISASSELTKMRNILNQTQDDILLNSEFYKIGKIYEKDLEAQISIKDDKASSALNLIIDAIKIDSTLDPKLRKYLYISPRVMFGDLLLQNNFAERAEVIYRENLILYPDDPWSLNGLKIALQKQKKRQEAEAIEDRFKKSWLYSDYQIKNIRF